MLGLLFVNGGLLLAALAAGGLSEDADLDFICDRS